MSRSDSPRTESPLWLKIAYYAGVVLAAVFLVVSIISWNVVLGGCALVLAVLLSRNLDIVTAEPVRAGSGAASQPRL